MGKVVTIVTKLEVISLIMEEKDPFEMPPDEQIEAGKSFKEFSSLLNEIVDGMG